MRTLIEVDTPRRRRVLRLAAAGTSIVLLVAGLLAVGSESGRQGVDVAAGGSGDTPVLRDTVPATVRPVEPQPPPPSTGPPTTVASGPAVVAMTTSTTARRNVAPVPTTRPHGPAATAPSTSPLTAAKPTTTGLYVISADSGSLQRIATGRVYEPVWSPDGSRLVFVRDNQLVTVNADGTGERVIASPATPLRPDWSPDGRSVVFIRDGAAVVASIGGGEPRRLAEGGVCAVGWSPDGNRIAFAAAVIMKNTLEIVQLDGTDRRIVSTSVGCDGRIAWSPEGTRLGYLDFNVGPAVIDVATGARTPLTTQRNMGWPMSWSPSGDELAFADYLGTTNNLAIARADGGGVRTLAIGAVGPDWSPNGRRIAFQGNRNPDRSGELLTHLYVIDASGRGERLLVGDTGSTHVDTPVWAPDSIRIAFGFTA